MSSCKQCHPSNRQWSAKVIICIARLDVNTLNPKLPDLSQVSLRFTKYNMIHSDKIARENTKQLLKKRIVFFVGQGCGALVQSQTKKKSIPHIALVGQKDNCLSQLARQHVPLQCWTCLSFLSHCMSMLFSVLYSCSVCCPLPSCSVCAFLTVPSFPCSAGSGLSGREESASRCCSSEACHPASTLGKVVFPWEP